MGLTGFVIIHVFIASISPAQGERNQMLNAKFTRPVNAMPMSTTYIFDLLHDEEDEVCHVVDDPLGQRGERPRHFGGQRQSQAEEGPRIEDFLDLLT